MAFRTVPGKEYQAKNIFDAFIETQENKARSGDHRVTNSIAINAVQVAGIASDAVSRGLNKGWVMAQKATWSMQQRSLESQMQASSGKMGMLTAGPRRTEVAKIEKMPAMPIKLQVVRQVANLVTVKWTTNLAAVNPSARDDALLSVTQAQVMVDGRFRPHSFLLGLRENGERKLEITIDVGEWGDHAIQIRTLDTDKWSKWSDSLSVSVAKSDTQTPKLTRKKAMVNGETGLFSRPDAGVSMFLTGQREATSTVNASTTIQSPAAAETSKTEEKKTFEDVWEGSGELETKIARRPTKEAAFNDTSHALPGLYGDKSGGISRTGPGEMFRRTISAPAMPAYLLKRTVSAAAPPPELLAGTEDGNESAHISPKWSYSPNKASVGDDHRFSTHDERRIAPSRAHATAKDEFRLSRVQSAPDVSSVAPPLGFVDGSGGGKAVPRMPTPPPREGSESASHAAVRGVSTFRRAASIVSGVLRVNSMGAKSTEGGKDGEGRLGDEKRDDTKEGRFGVFGLKRTLSAPSASISTEGGKDGEGRLGDEKCDETREGRFGIFGLKRTLSAPSAPISVFARLRSLPMADDEVAVEPKMLCPNNPQQLSIYVEVHLVMPIETINIPKELQIKLAIAAMLGVADEVVVIVAIQRAGRGSRITVTTKLSDADLKTVRNRLNIDRLNLEFKRRNLQGAKVVKEVKAPKEVGSRTPGAIRDERGGVPGMNFSQFKNLLSAPIAQMELIVHVTASKLDVMLMLDSIQEGIREAGALDKFKDAQVKFSSQKEVKGSRLQPTKVLVTWNLSAPENARDFLFETLNDSVSGLRKWSAAKGLPEVIVAELTIKERAKPISHFKRAAAKIKIINTFSNATKNNGEEGTAHSEFERSASAPAPGIAENDGHNRSDVDGCGVSEKPTLGGFQRAPSAPEAIGSSPSREEGVMEFKRTPSAARNLIEGSGIVDPVRSPLKKVKQKSMSAFFNFARMPSATVQEEIAFESRAGSTYFFRSSSAEGEFTRASSAERVAGLLRKATAAVGSVFSRSSSAAPNENRGSEEDLDRFGRAGSAGVDRFSRAGSTAQNEDNSNFSKAGITSAAEEDEGLKTPILHIEPRRLALKNKYQPPSVSVAGPVGFKHYKPKSSGGSSDEFGKAPSLTSLAAPKPKTAPKEVTKPAEEPKKSRRRNGYAAHTWSTGEKYEGEWNEGVMHGNGKYFYADDYEDCLRPGVGQLHRYEGEFRDGKFNGRGFKHMKNGDTYDGEWKDGKFHGKGTFFSKETGDTYFGGFWKGRFHGRGTQVSSDGLKKSILYDAKKDFLEHR
jgi:hypothetical protein